MIGAVVFDLDGTLIDSRRDLAAAVNRVREERGFEPLPVDEVVAMVGRGARVLVRRALPESVGGSDFDRAFQRFLDVYLDRCLEETAPYDGVEAMLERLGGRLPLGLLTNKPERHTRKILDGLGLAGRFREVVAGDTLSTKKPDPAGLRHLATPLETPVERTLFVGDSTTDAETAAAAGARLALVRWGFGTAEELAAAEAELRPETPRELTRAILGD